MSDLEQGMPTVRTVTNGQRWIPNSPFIAPLIRRRLFRLRKDVLMDNCRRSDATAERKYSAATAAENTTSYDTTPDETV